MKNILNIITIIILSIVYCQIFAQTSSAGQIEVRIISNNNASAEFIHQGQIKIGENIEDTFSNVNLVENMKISNNTYVGWKLKTESKNKGKLFNGEFEIDYSIKINNETKNLLNPVVISSKKYNKNSKNIDISMNVNDEFKNKEKIVGTYNDTINLTLYAND